MIALPLDEPSLLTLETGREHGRLGRLRPCLLLLLFFGLVRSLLLLAVELDNKPNAQPNSVGASESHQDQRIGYTCGKLLNQSVRSQFPIILVFADIHIIVLEISWKWPNH